MTNLESDMTFPTYDGEVKPATGATLFALGSWLRRGKASADARQLFLEAAAKATPSTATAGATTRSCAPPTA